jgi:hypothetical protein
MPIQRLLPGALLCALFPTLSVDAKEQRGLAPADIEVAKSLPMQVRVVQPRLRPQIRYNYVDTAQAGVSAGDNLYNGGGIGYGQAMGVGLAGGLIAGAIINGAEKAAAKRAVSAPYQLISQAKCDLPLVDSHQAVVASALQRAGWRAQGEDSMHAAAKAGPRYAFTLSTSLSPDFSAVMTTIDAAGYAPDASGKVGRKATWQDSLVVVSDGLWLAPKTQADIDQMLAAEKQRYAASGADALIDKVNAAGANASQQDRKRANLMANQHAENLADARDAGWSDASTVMRRAMLWSQSDCTLLEKTVRSNLEHAEGLMQALLAHSLPAPLETQPQPAKPVAAIVNRPDPSSLDLPINVGMPEGSVVAAAPTRVIESMPGGVYVSHLSDEYITLGFRYTLLDD